MPEIIHLEAHRAKRGLTPAKHQTRAAPPATPAPVTRPALRQRLAPFVVVAVLVVLVGIPSGSPALTLLVAGFGYWLTKTAATPPTPALRPRNAPRPVKPRRAA